MCASFSRQTLSQLKSDWILGGWPNTQYCDTPIACGVKNNMVVHCEAAYTIPQFRAFDSHGGIVGNEGTDRVDAINILIRCQRIVGRDV